ILPPPRNPDFYGCHSFRIELPFRMRFNPIGQHLMTKFKLPVLLVLLTMVVSLSQMQSATSLPASPRPVWSPDGQHIVYRGAGGTYVMDRDGENSRQIAPNNVFFEHWTPDSQTLIFTGGFVDNQNQ